MSAIVIAEMDVKPELMEEFKDFLKVGAVLCRCQFTKSSST